MESEAGGGGKRAPPSMRGSKQFMTWFCCAPADLFRPRVLQVVSAVALQEIH